MLRHVPPTSRPRLTIGHNPVADCATPTRDRHFKAYVRYKDNGELNLGYLEMAQT